MKLESLKELYVHELRDLYSAEQQLLKALPRMAKGASAPDLQKGFLQHEEQTRDQVERLEKIFRELGQKPTGKKCVGMEGLLEEGKELLTKDMDPNVRDAGLIAAAQKVEHYEIAGYGSVRTYAEMLGHKDAAQLLQKTLEEEMKTDQKLTQLAQGGINMDALGAERSE